MVYLDNVRQFFTDHPEIYGSDPDKSFTEFLATVSPKSLRNDELVESEAVRLGADGIRHVVIMSGEVSRILGKENFELFGRDLELPAHRAIIRRAFARS